METKVTTFNQDLTGIENLECRIEKYRRKKGKIMKKTGEKEWKTTKN